MKVKQNEKQCIVYAAIYKQDIMVCKISINPGMAKKTRKNKLSGRKPMNVPGSTCCENGSDPCSKQSSTGSGEGV
jgi:hypothetical protein